MRAGMSPGGSSRGSFASNTGTSAGTSAACRSRCSRSACSPAFAQVRIDSDSSQSPMTFFRKRMRPSTPPSLVKLARRASSVSTGDGSSMPTSDQVPQEMYAASSPVEGHPDDGRGGVVRADRRERELVPDPELLAHRRPSTRAEPRARFDERRQRSNRQAEAREQLGVPGVAARGQQARRRGVRPLGDLGAGQPAADQVGDEQQAVGEVERAGRGGRPRAGTGC